MKQKYNLHKAPEVERSAKRAQQRTGEKVPQNPEVRIQNYLDRLKNIINSPKLEEHPDFDRQERNINLLKSALYQQFVIKPEKVPESYFDSVKRRHHDEGHGDIEIPEDYRHELLGIIVNDQKG